VSSRALAASVVLLLMGCGGGSSTPGPSPAPSPSTPPPTSREGWTLLAGSPLAPPNDRHDDIFFLTEALGWLVNIRGDVYRTQDGGVSWSQLARVPPGLRCVGFASPERGWAGSLNLTNMPEPDLGLFETTDGGVTWANISTRIRGDFVAGLCGLRVVTPTSIYATGRWNGPAVFVASRDGGRSWSSRNLAPQATGLIDLWFFNEQDGFVVGGQGLGTSEAEQRASRTVILATADGGASWETVYLGDNPGEWAWKIQFVTTSIGFVSMEGPTPAGSVLKTSDGGRSWRRLAVEPGQSFEGVGFVTPERGWLGSGATLHATTDGGATWRRIDFGPRVNRIRALRSDLAYAAGDRVYRWMP
jgi:photosystem II stability/assembly factor-like uncharacterized protein